MLFSTAHAASKATCVAQGFLDKLNEAVLYPLIILLLAVAFLIFLYGGLKFILKPSSLAGESNEGRNHMLYGIIGLVVMASAGAILAIAAGTFNLSTKSGNCGGPGGGTYENPLPAVGGMGPGAL